MRSLDKAEYGVSSGHLLSPNKFSNRGKVLHSIDSLAKRVLQKSPNNPICDKTKDFSLKVVNSVSLMRTTPIQPMKLGEAGTYMGPSPLCFSLFSAGGHIAGY